MQKTIVRILGCLGVVAAVAAPAGAQTLADRTNDVAITSTASALRAVTFMPEGTAAVSPADQGGTRRPVPTASEPSWRPLVFGGFASAGGGGFTVGGGVIGNNFRNREEFGLQLDAAYTNYGDFGISCAGCDNTGISSLAFSGAFLYHFQQMNSGWRPFAGGGIVILHFSVDTGFAGFQYGGTSGGIQVQGGLRKVRDSGKVLGVEARIQSTAGGAFIALGRYEF